MLVHQRVHICMTSEHVAACFPKKIIVNNLIRWHFCHVFSIVHGHFESSCCYGEGFQRERLELQESAEDGGQLGVYRVASFRAAASLPEGSMN